MTKLQHQPREVNHGVKEIQLQAKIPAHKTISAVRTNHTCWNNIFCQVQRNNLMRPILTPVLTKYKRVHSSEVVLLS